MDHQQPRLLFSNYGAPQTSDFAFVNGGYYTESGLMGVIENKPAIAGDVNGDGVVTAADITAIYDVLLGVNYKYEDTADITGDGVVTAADITAAYDIMLGGN